MLREWEGNNPKIANNQISFAFKLFGFMRRGHVWKKANTFYENICSLQTHFFTRKMFQLASFLLKLVWTFSTSNFGIGPKKN